MSEDTDKGFKIAFAPGALEEMEATMSPEEIQKIMDELKQLADSGELFENSVALDLDQIKIDDPELYAKLTDDRADGIFAIDLDVFDKPVVH